MNTTQSSIGGTSQGASSAAGSDHPGAVLRGSHRFEEADTEGHMPRVRWIEDAPAPDDAEGHGRKIPGDAGVDDAEGHGRFSPSEADVDDAEGHGRFTPSEAEVDDVEGHGRKVPSDAGVDDVDGHVNFRPLDRSNDR